MLRKCFQILQILTRQQVYSILQPPRLLLSLKQSHTSVSFHAFRSREAVSQASRHKHDWKEKRLCKAGFPVTDFLHLTFPSGFRKSTACDCSTLMSPSRRNTCKEIKHCNSKARILQHPTSSRILGILGSRPKS